MSSYVDYELRPDLFLAPLRFILDNLDKAREQRDRLASQLNDVRTELGVFYGVISGEINAAKDVKALVRIISNYEERFKQLTEWARDNEEPEVINIIANGKASVNSSGTRTGRISSASVSVEEKVSRARPMGTPAGGGKPMVTVVEGVHIDVVTTVPVEEIHLTYVVPALEDTVPKPKKGSLAAAFDEFKKHIKKDEG